MRQSWRGDQSERRTGQHVARFILVALYTGTRAGAVCGAAIRPTIGRGYVDLERGVFYRRAPGSRETKKRQPAVRLPDRLLAHLRRWERKGFSKAAVIEWNGTAVERIHKAFRTAREAAGLGGDVVPHTLRHTAATWLMQNGCDLWEAAGYLGMSVETLEKVYGHHHPGHHEGARRAITYRDRTGTDKREPKRNTLLDTVGHTEGNRAPERIATSFGTRGSEVRILSLRPSGAPLRLGGAGVVQW